MKTGFLKKAVPLIFFGFLFLTNLSTPFSANREKEIILKYKPSSELKNYLCTTYSQTTDILNISDESGGNRTLKKDTFDYSEFNKEKNQKNAEYSSIEESIKKIFMKNENQDGPVGFSKPEELTLIFDNLGHLKEPYHFKNFETIGMPLILPDKAVKISDKWQGQIDFKDKDLPPLSLNKNYKLTGFSTIGGHKVAEIAYTFEASLSATELSNDPLIMHKITDLQKNKIESLSFEGNGNVAYDFENGHIVTHTITLTRRLSKAFIEDKRRVLEELVTISEYAEALVP